MAEPNQAEEQSMTARERKWATYSADMKVLFVERDKWPVDSREREAAAQAILDRWVAEPEA